MSSSICNHWSMHLTEPFPVSQGIVISCCLICAVLFCSAAWDYILQYWAAFAPHVLAPPEQEAVHPEAEQVCFPDW